MWTTLQEISSLSYVILILCKYAYHNILLRNILAWEKVYYAPNISSLTTYESHAIIRLTYCKRDDADVKCIILT